MNKDSAFTDLGLAPELLKAIVDKDYQSPTAIQHKAIPIVLKGKDLMATAQTGTGKTAAFTLPILHRLMQSQPNQPNQAKVLILAPTRELAVQIHQNIESYAKYSSIKSAVVYGGVKINPQMMALRKGVGILVATPGRLMDLYQKNAIKFSQLEVLVLDEADRMLDMGFIEDIKEIIELLPKQRQTLMFSATFSSEVHQLAKGIVHQAVEISVTPSNVTASTITQWIIPVDKKRKPALLLKLMQQYQWQQVLIFSKTKQGANKLTRFLEEKGYSAVAIHGDKSQSARSRALEDFKQAKVDILVATDLASRGLDIPQLPQVINFDMPNIAADYIHRIGRTGRAGMAGLAISLVSADEVDILSDIEHLINQLLERKLIDGFEPRHDVPITKLGRKIKKPKKPKKPKTYSSNGKRPVGSKIAPKKKANQTHSKQDSNRRT